MDILENSDWIIWHVIVLSGTPSSYIAMKPLNLNTDQTPLEFNLSWYFHLGRLLELLKHYKQKSGKGILLAKTFCT